MHQNPPSSSISCISMQQDKISHLSQPTGWFEFIFNTVDKQSDKLLSILLMQSNSVEMNVFHSTPSLAIYNCHFDQIRQVWTVKSGVKYYYKILDFINCHLSTLDLINKRLHYSSDGFSRENTQD